MKNTQLSCVKADYQPFQLAAVSLEVTNRCNQRCLYCYKPDRDPEDSQESDSSTDAIIELVDLIERQPSVRQITLTGGEPLIRRDILSIIDHIAGKGLHIGIVSNASMVTSVMAAELMQRPISYVQVTFLAADPITHDAIGGVGSFAARKAGVQRLISAGVPVGGAFICTKLNYRNTGAALEMMHALGMTRHMCFMRYCAAGCSLRHRTRISPTLEELLEAMSQANSFGATHNLKVYNKIPIPPCLIDDSKYPQIEFSSCGAAVEEGECFVDQWGSVRLCGPSRDKLGNIRETSLSDILKSDMVLAWKEKCAPACRPCVWRTTCRGGCPSAENDEIYEECLSKQASAKKEKAYE
jgi:radical SAM protein with 4Fe4S-binding SPASM domain